MKKRAAYERQKAEEKAKQTEDEVRRIKVRAARSRRARGIPEPEPEKPELTRQQVIAIQMRESLRQPPTIEKTKARKELISDVRKYPKGTKFIPTETGYDVRIPESAALEAAEKMLKKSERYPPILREYYQFQSAMQGLFSSWGFGGRKSRIGAVPGRGLVIGAKRETYMVPQHPVDVTSGVLEHIGWSPKGSGALLAKYPAYTAGSIFKEAFSLYAFGKVLQPVTSTVSRILHKGKYVGKELIPGTTKFIEKTPTEVLKKVPYTSGKKVLLTPDKMATAQSKLISKLGQKGMDISFPIVRTTEGGKRVIGVATQEWYKRGLRGVTRFYHGIEYSKPLTKVYSVPYKVTTKGYEGFVRTQLAIGKRSLTIPGTKPVLHTYVGERGGKVFTTLKGYTRPLPKPWIEKQFVKGIGFQTRQVPELVHLTRTFWKHAPLTTTRLATITIPARTISISPLIYGTARFGLQRQKPIQKQIKVTVPKSISERRTAFVRLPIAKTITGQVTKPLTILKAGSKQTTSVMSASAQSYRQIMKSLTSTLGTTRTKKAAPIYQTTGRGKYPPFFWVPKGGGRGRLFYDEELWGKKYKFRKFEVPTLGKLLKGVSF